MRFRPRYCGPFSLAVIFLWWNVSPILVTAMPPAGQDARSFARDRQVLARYRTELQQLRRGRPAFDLPRTSFFLFGMGPRPKFIYRSGKLIAWPSGDIVRQWEVQQETIVPPSYSVWLKTVKGKIHISENESGVLIDENGERTVLAQGHVSLPDFRNEQYPLVLRVLHHEILVNLVDGKPVPNFLVYPKPWYRDGAMMAMVLRRTGNIGLIRDWVMSLRDPYDHNNGGIREADNLGEVLFLISCVSDRNHPLVVQTLKEAESFRKGNYIIGKTDFAEHPVYQTKWLKFGLRSLGLFDDSLFIPKTSDSYASLFWWGFPDAQIGPEFSADAAMKYPYLAWAQDHHRGGHTGPVSAAEYPLSWEADASQADYQGMSLISSDFTAHRLAAPHTWHAAEMFLLLSKQPAQR
ncbi:MAG TPA: hypothetical protein VLT90_11745 [Terriglobales bacterium]|nr:hypothetical protein [Terriglobales bacterium]